MKKRASRRAGSSVDNFKYSLLHRIDEADERTRAVSVLFIDSIMPGMQIESISREQIAK